ncbi:TetR/AcrR family transcriptional regulator [Paractinoplanes globisporus]|uniref:TetR/AcrR family transcriptional regulator n=1 Tax=Paractinoplanes globisporus TaxID=113565 RepID=A0ABW6WTU8_9ACTN|nr:TetR/AcrR family transcriptional regulator [Actinoplanes globisporus]
MTLVTGVPNQAKRQAILEAATEAFLHSGYAASVDEIAAVAGVGKQTVYRHFGDKQALFLAAVAAARSATPEAPAELDAALPDDPVEGLTRVGEQILAAALSPTVAALHRLTIAEIGNHPELSAHWGDGTDPFIDARLAACLRHYDEAGLLAVPDPSRAARQFAYLLITEGRMASAYGTRNLTLEQRHRIAAETADLIARAHRPA